MKLLISLSVILSFVVSADGHEASEYKYEHDMNQAEYYICLLYTSPSPRD